MFWFHKTREIYQSVDRLNFSGESLFRVLSVLVL